MTTKYIIETVAFINTGITEDEILFIIATKR